MELGSKFVYLGNEDEDEEEFLYMNTKDIILSDSDSCSDDDGETCMLDILDTAGQEEYSSVRDQYVRSGDGFVIIYSVTDTKSFSEAEAIYYWLKRIKEEEPVAILVANKQDLDSEMVVTNDQGQTLASKLGLQFFQASAKTGEGVEDAITGLVSVIPRCGKNYKIVMLGSGAVGKSNLTLRFVIDIFVNDYDPTVEDLYRKIIQVKGLKPMGERRMGAFGKDKKVKNRASKSQRNSAEGQAGSARGSHSKGAAYVTRSSSGSGANRGRPLPPPPPAASPPQSPPPLPTRPHFLPLKSAGRLFSRRTTPPPLPLSPPPSPPLSPPPSPSPPLLPPLLVTTSPPLSPPPCSTASRPSSKRQHQQQEELHRQLSSDRPPLPPHAIPSTNKTRIKTRMTDGNVVLIPLGDLAKEPNLVTGEPITCEGCQAVLVDATILYSRICNDSSEWTCEFCGQLNSYLCISEEEIPKEDSIDFMLSPPTQILKSEKGATANEQNRATPGTIVYCIDISSSMNRTYKMPASQAAWQTVKASGDQKYVSKLTRLDCIKKAVTRLIEQLKLEKPEQKVLLAVFASDVTVKAGGANHMTPSFDNLEHQTMAELLDKGLNSASSYPLVPIEESYESIVAAVKALIAREGNGKRSTALGPALSLSVGFLRKVPNSQVVLCTDGLPNVGIGCLNDIIRISRNMFERGADFYRQIGTYACNKNITINILAVDGPSVEMRSISEAATLTGGTTNKINPAEIVRELRIIAQKEVVANSVSVTFYLHPNFVFDEPDFGDNLSRLEKEVGSVKKETDMTFRFKLKDPSKAEDIDSVPFQVQIIYTRNDGMKCMRVLSKRAGATRDRATMEQYVNVAVVGVAAMRTTANLAKVGKGKEAQEYMKLVKRLVKRGSNTSEQLEERLAFEAQAESWDKELTDNNEVYCTSHLTDLSSKMVQQAMSSNMIQHLAMGKKIDVVTNRKMNAAAKKAYYNYTYDL